MKKIFVYIAITFVLAACAQTNSMNTLNNNSKIKLPTPPTKPNGFISTPVPDYFLDGGSVKLKQNNSLFLVYDMVSNLSEGYNGLSENKNLYSHSMRTSYVLDCAKGRTGDMGIKVYSNFYGLGEELTSIPKPFEWDELPDISLKTFMAQSMCMKNGQNFKNKTPQEIRQGFDNALSNK